MFRDLPQTFLIQGSPWRIREETLPESKRRGSITRRGFYGLTLPAAREIIIQHGLSPELRDATILHELLHACYASSNDEMLGHALEEHVVQQLEGPLYKTLRQLLK